MIAAPLAAQDIEGGPAAYVIVVDAPAAEAEALRDALAEAWQGAGHTVVPVPDPVELGHPDPALLAAARESFADLRPRAAIAALEEYVARVDALGGGITRREWISALLLLARARRAVGDLALADEVIDRALTVEPELRLSPAEYPPPLLEAVEARRESIAALGRAPLRLRHVPPGLRVGVDGAEPTSPASLPELVPGVHLLRFTAPGRRPRAARVEVRPEETVDVSLAPDVFHALRRRDSSDHALRTAAARLGAVPLRLRAPPSTGGRAEVWDGAQDRRAAFRVPSEASASSVARAAVAALARTTGRPARRRRRILGASVAAVAVVAAGITAWALSRREPRGFRLELESGGVSP